MNRPVTLNLLAVILGALVLVTGTTLVCAWCWRYETPPSCQDSVETLGISAVPVVRCEPGARVSWVLDSKGEHLIITCMCGAGDAGTTLDAADASTE